MADTTFHGAQEHRSAGDRVRAFFSAIWHGLVRMGENSSRYRRMHALNAMTDEQLAERGVKREDIVRHVFADVFYT